MHTQTARQAQQVGTCLVRIGSVNGFINEVGSILMVKIGTFAVRCALNGTMAAVSIDRIAPVAQGWAIATSFN